MKFKQGDTVRIIADITSHTFPIGQEIVITCVHEHTPFFDRGGYYETVRDTDFGPVTMGVLEEEVEELVPKPPYIFEQLDVL